MSVGIPCIGTGVQKVPIFYFHEEIRANGRLLAWMEYKSCEERNGTWGTGAESMEGIMTRMTWARPDPSAFAMNQILS